jgi:hypothetical protein
MSCRCHAHLHPEVTVLFYEFFASAGRRTHRHLRSAFYRKAFRWNAVEKRPAAFIANKYVP